IRAAGPPTRQRRKWEDPGWVRYPPPANQRAKGFGARMRILSVEDDSALVAALTRALNQEAYAVDLAADGEAAHQALAGTAYDLVVLDIALPKVDGLTVLRRLRDRRARPPVLILTARDTLDDRFTGLDLGADDYMTKPFDLPEF